MRDKEIPGAGKDDYKNHLEEIEDYIWSKNGPKFGITNDPISARIPVIKIDSWRDLPKILDEPFFKQKESNFIYRGQKKYAWSLSPTLARVAKDGVVRKKIADQLLQDFKLKIRGRIHNHTILREDDKELWSVGQHHGLRTPLLDWTKSPYVALFFAFNELDAEDDINVEWKRKTNQYRCLYVLDKQFVQQENEMSSVQIFEPTLDDHGRLVSQDGLFTISDYETTIETEIIDYVIKQESFSNLNDDEQAEEIAQYICKIYIPNNDREGCLKFLRKMNVHHASLFPDLIGASQHSNQLIEEYATRHEIAELDQIYEIIETDEAGPIIEDVQGVTKEDKDKKTVVDEEADVETQIIDEIKSIIDADKVNEELSSTIAENLVENIIPKLKTDWYKREPLLAEIRNTIRSTFKQYNIYISPADARLNGIVELLKSKEELKK